MRIHGQDGLPGSILKQLHMQIQLRVIVLRIIGLGWWYVLLLLLGTTMVGGIGRDTSTHRRHLCGTGYVAIATIHAHLLRGGRHQ